MARGKNAAKVNASLRESLAEVERECERLRRALRDAEATQATLETKLRRLETEAHPAVVAAESAVERARSETAEAKESAVRNMHRFAEIVADGLYRAKEGRWTPEEWEEIRRIGGAIAFEKFFTSPDRAANRNTRRNSALGPSRIKKGLEGQDVRLI